MSGLPRRRFNVTIGKKCGRLEPDSTADANFRRIVLTGFEVQAPPYAR
jgi:hypothetical protein